MNFASGSSKAQIFALRICPDQLLFVDVLRVSPAWRGSKERSAVMNSEKWVLTSICAPQMATLLCLGATYSFQLRYSFSQSQILQLSVHGCQCLHSTLWGRPGKKTFKYRGFCEEKKKLVYYLDSTGKWLLWKMRDLSINRFFFSPKLSIFCTYKSGKEPLPVLLWQFLQSFYSKCICF